MSALSLHRVFAPLAIVFATGAGAGACVDDSSPSAPPVAPDAGLGLDGGERVDAGAATDTGAFESGQSDAATEPPCTPPTNGPTTHDQTISADETWAADDGPHLVTFDVVIKSAATVTIEPCAEVRIDEKRTLTVEGKLVAEGTAVRPITFVPNVAGKKWGTIRSLTTPGAEIRLTYVTLEGGGNVTNPGLNLVGVLDISGPAGVPAPVLFVDHVAVSKSANMGVVLNTGAFAPGSTALTISGAAGYALRSSPRVAGTIPTGAYTGNGKDAIFLSSGQVSEDATYRDLGVPYEIGDVNQFGTIRVARLTAAASVPVLTIEPGVTLKFRDNGVSNPSALYIGSDTSTAPATGALVAVGTPSKRIVFTSLEATPASEDWLGLYFAQLDSRSRLDFVDVQYAGMFSGAGGYSCSTPSLDIGSILVLGGTEPATQFVTNTAISDSRGDGIVRGYTFTGATPLDMMPSNTFTNVARCKQSYPKSIAGGCPSVVPCP